MAGTNKEVKLNLNITAKDQAKAIFEKFAQSLAETMDSVEKILAKGFNGKKLVQDMEEAVGGVNTALKGVKTQQFEDALDRIANTDFLSRGELVQGFDVIREDFNNVSLDAVKTADLTTAQLRKIMQALQEDPIEAYKNKFQEGFQKIVDSSYTTRADLEKEFMAIRGQFTENGLSAVDASQLTTGALKDIVSSVKEVNYAVVNDMKGDALDPFIQKLQELQQTAYKTRTELEEDFDRIKTSLANTSLASKDASQMTTTALKDIVSAYDKVKIAVVNDMKDATQAVNPFDQAMEKIKNTVYLTASDLKTRFEEIKSSMASIKDVDIAQFTQGQMKKIVEATDQTTIEVVKDMEKMKEVMSHGVDMNTAVMNLQMTGQMVQGLGQKVTGFFAESVKSAADFDQQMVNTKSSLEANMEGAKLSGKQFDNLKQQALGMGEAGFFSANQLSDAMNTLAKNGLNYSQITKGAIQVTHDIAASNNEDLQTTANVVSDIYNEMGGLFKKQGLNAQQASQQIGNSMTVALHHSKISMDDFMNTMKYVGPQASAMGVGIKDVSAAIGILGEHGIRSAQAGTTLRRFLTNLTPASKAAASVMEQLGLTTKNGGNIFYTSSGQMKSMADIQAILHDKIGSLTPQMQQFAIKTIFGQYALSGMTAIIGTSTGKFQQLRNDMNDNGTMAEILKTKQEGLGMTLQRLNAHWQTMQKAIGEQLKPVIVALVGVLTSLMDKWDHMNPNLQKGIIMFGAVAGAVLLLGGGLLATLGTVGMFITGLEGIGLGVGAIASGFGIVIAVIAAVGAVVYGLYYMWQKNMGGIQGVVSDFANWFKGYFGGIFKDAEKDVSSGIASIKKAFSGFTTNIPLNKALNTVFKDITAGMKVLSKDVGEGVKTVTTWFAKMAPDIGKALQNIARFIEWLSPLWKALWVVFKFVVGVAIDWVVSIIKGFWEVISGVFDLIIHLLSGNWKAAWGDVWQIVKGAVTLALNFFGGFEEKLGVHVVEILSHLGIFGKGIGKVFELVGSTITKLSQKAWDVVKGIFGDSIKGIETLLNGLSKEAGKILDIIKNLFEGKFKDAFNGVGKIMGDGLKLAKSILQNIFDAFDKIFGGLPSKVLGWIQKVVSNFGSKLGDLKTNAGNALNDMIQSFEQWLGNVLPGKMGTWATNAINMFVGGIKKGIGAVTGAVQGVAGAIKGFLGFHSPTRLGPLTDSDQYMPNMMKMYQTGIDKHRDKIKASVGAVAMDIHNSITQKGTVAQQINQHTSNSSHVHVPQNHRKHGNDIVVNINIDGRSAKTDKELAEKIANTFRTHLAMNV